MAAKRRKYNEEFKRDAVTLSFHTDKTIKEISDDLGINRSLLVRWRTELDELGEQAFLRSRVKKTRPTGRRKFASETRTG